MRRLLISITAMLMLATVLAQPAAADGAERDRPGEVTEADAEVADRVRPVDAKPRPDEPKHDIEALDLECSGRINDAGEPAVGCKWSQAHSERAAGYVLYRSHGDHRTAVFRTDDVSTTSFVDTEARFGVRYRYKVVAINAKGNKVGASRATTAGVPAPEPDVEVLEIACEAIQADDSDGQGAICKWSPTTVESAVGYQLWRAVDRDGRELVWRGGLDTTSQTDRVPADAKLAHYAVLGVNEAGDIVARSRAVTVRLENNRPKPTVVAERAPLAEIEHVPSPSNDRPSVATIASISAPAQSPTVAVPGSANGRSELRPQAVNRAFERLVQMLRIF